MPPRKERRKQYEPPRDRKLDKTPLMDIAFDLIIEPTKDRAYMGHAVAIVDGQYVSACGTANPTSDGAFTVDARDGKAIMCSVCAARFRAARRQADKERAQRLSARVLGVCSLCGEPVTATQSYARDAARGLCHLTMCPKERRKYERSRRL